MKEKNSPRDAPSGERSAAASANVARGDSACFARRPLQLAGESKNILGTFNRRARKARREESAQRSLRSLRFLSSKTPS
jgi:hypothetical protein